MSVRIVPERRSKSKTMVAQQRHRRQHWWNVPPVDRAAHLGWCVPCRLKYQDVK